MPFGRKGFKVAHDPEATKHKEADTRRTKREETLQEWLHAKDDFFDGIDFSLEYLGYNEVTDPTGRQNTSEIIHRFVQKKKGEKVTLKITVNGLLIANENFDKSHPMAFVQIYRISWTMIDRIRRKVFCFIARDKATKKLLLHIFHCSNKRQASAVTLTVAQAFQIAFEAFQKRDEETRRAVKQKLREQEMEEAKAAAEAGGEDEDDHTYEEIPADIQAPLEATSASEIEKPNEEKPQFREKPLRRSSSRKVSVRLRHRQSTAKRPTSGEDEDKLIEMPDEDIKEEFKRLTLRRETPDLPDMDFDPDDKTDEVAQFLTGGNTAENILEGKEDAD